MMIRRNLHLWDRIARGLIGFIVIGFALFNGSYIEEPLIEGLLIIFGILNLISLFTGWCPVYSLAHISTRPEDK